MRLLLLLFPLSCLLTTCATNDESGVTSVMSIIVKSVQLFENGYREFNLDGVLGFRILSECIIGALERFDATKDPNAGELMKSLVTRLNETLSHTSTHLQDEDLGYYRNFYKLISIPFWKLPLYWSQTNSTLVYKESSADASLCLDPDTSDRCITAILGNSAKNIEPCTVDEGCLKQMKHEGCANYSLNHQLLYFIIGKMNLCSPDEFGKDFEYYASLYCANMMKINTDIEQSGYPMGQQDLFMENIMMCGGLCGFSDFYKPKWMDKISIWQDPSTGCFGDIEPDSHSEKYGNKNQLLKRVKRRERYFLDKCESHKTAMAVGALGGFLYYFASE